MLWSGFGVLVCDSESQKAEYRKLSSLYQELPQWQIYFWGFCRVKIYLYFILNVTCWHYFRYPGSFTTQNNSENVTKFSPDDTRKYRRQPFEPAFPRVLTVFLTCRIKIWTLHSLHSLIWGLNVTDALAPFGGNISVVVIIWDHSIVWCKALQGEMREKKRADRYLVCIFTMWWQLY